LWFELDGVGNFSIDVSHRSGNTVGEVEDASWASIGSISCNSPSEPKISVDKNARLHQIKWGTNTDSEQFKVSKILFRFIPGGKW